MSSDISYVYFDLDDTLLDHRWAEREALAELHARHRELTDRPFGEVLDVYHEVNTAVWKAYGAGDLSKAQAKRTRFERMFTRLGIDWRGVGALDPARMGDTYLQLYSGHWRFRDGAQEAFIQIAEHVPVGIVTNGFSEIQRAKLSRFPELERLSTAVVISEEFGVMKPDFRLFQHAAERAGVPARQILYVGDSLYSDVRGGLESGWQVAWIDGDPALAPDAFCFYEWQDLLRRLRH